MRYLPRVACPARASVMTIVLLALLLQAAPMAIAQAEDTQEACEARYGKDAGTDDNSVPNEYACRVAATLGLRGALGDERANLAAYGITGMVALALVGYLFILIGRIWPKRILKLQALDAVQEVQAGEEATYHVILENRRGRRPIDVELSLTKPTPGWSAVMRVEKPLPSGFVELVGEDDAMRVRLSARRRQAHIADIRILVNTPRDADPEQWSELDITAIPYYKERPRARRSKESRIVTLVRTPETEVKIADVRHEPREIHPGDDVTTTVTVRNDGAADATGIPVALAIDDEPLGETQIDVPAGSEEVIAFKWTAPDSAARVRIALRR